MNYDKKSKNTNRAFKKLKSNIKIYYSRYRHRFSHKYFSKKPRYPNLIKIIMTNILYFHYESFYDFAVNNLMPGKNFRKRRNINFKNSFLSSVIMNYTRGEWMNIILKLIDKTLSGKESYDYKISVINYKIQAKYIKKIKQHEEGQIKEQHILNNKIKSILAPNCHQQEVKETRFIKWCLK